MKKLNLLLITMSFIFMSCQQADDIKESCLATNSCEVPEVVDKPDVPNIPELPSIPEQPKPSEPTPEEPKMVFGTNINFLNFSDESKAKVERALAALITVVKSPEFKDEVLHHTYNGTETFVNNGGKTNAEIYQTILNGAETLLPTTDHEMDLELKLYYKNNGVVGYTYPSKLRIYMNTKFFKRYDSEQVANNLMHEWLHKLGFKHDSKRTARRPYSVPYAVGNLLQDLIIELRQKGDLTLP